MDVKFTLNFCCLIWTFSAHKEGILINKWFMVAHIKAPACGQRRAANNDFMLHLFCYESARLRTNIYHDFPSSLVRQSAVSPSSTESDMREIKRSIWLKHAAYTRWVTSCKYTNEAVSSWLPSTQRCLCSHNFLPLPVKPWNHHSNESEKFYALRHIECEARGRVSEDNWPERTQSA